MLRLFLKNVYVFKTKNKVYKLVYANGAKLLRREFKAARFSSIDNSIWFSKGAYYSAFITVGDFFLVSGVSRMRLNPNQNEIDSFIQCLINQIPIHVGMRSWYDTFDTDSFEATMRFLPANTRIYITTLLEGVSLPVTAAHGDLIDKHFFYSDSGQIKLIDWEYFRENGSVITDILRCYMIRYTLSHRHDPYNPYVLKNRSFPIIFPDHIFGQTNFTPTLWQLSVLGAFTNVCLPVPNILIKKRAARLADCLKQLV